jgi:hypothetical protein
MAPPFAGLSLRWRRLGSGIAREYIEARYLGNASPSATMAQTYSGYGIPIMNDGDLREQISRLEERIEQLAEVIERCRKLMLFSKAAIAIGGLLIVAMMFGGIRFDAAAMIGAMTAVIGGTVLLGTNSSTSEQTLALLKAAEEQRAELIDRIDLQMVGEGDRGSLLPRPD